MDYQGQGIAVREQAAIRTDLGTSQIKPARHAAPMRQFAAADFRHELPHNQLEAFKQTNVVVSAGLAIGCLMSIVVAAGCSMTLFAASWQLGVAFYPLLTSIIARQQRGLEVLVHDGSHRSWLRSNPVWNDRLTNWLAAYPSFSSVFEYWTFHRIHHSDYGSERDPCFRRDKQMRAALEPGQFFRTIWRYTIGWYVETARKPMVILRAAIWHCFVFLAPLSISMGLGRALLVWLMFWAVPQLVFLPWLRFVAEIEEHDYSAGQTEASGTLTNVGWLHNWIIHPLKDGYHLIHHAFPSVPQWRHKAVHEALMKSSPLYRSSRGRRTPLGTQSTLG